MKLSAQAVNRFAREKILYFSGCVLLLLSIVLTYSNLDQGMLDLFINSDTVGMPQLFKDLVHNDGDLSHWTWVPAPSAFPDITMYFVIAAIFKLNTLRTLLIYSIVQVFIITFLMTYIYKKLAPENLKKYSWLIPWFLSLYFIETVYFSKDVFFAFLMLACGYHIGAFINTLFIVGLYLSSWPKIIRYSLMFFIMAAGMFSDRLLFVILCLPLIFTLLVSIRKSAWKDNVAVILVVCAGGLLGWKFFKWASDHGILHYFNPYRMYAFDMWRPSLQVFYDQLSTYFKAPGFRLFQLTFTFLAIIASLIYAVLNIRKANEQKNKIIMLYGLISLLNLAAPIINGNYVDWSTLRYNIYPFFFSAIIFALSIGYLLNKLKPLQLKIASATLIITCLIFIGFKISFKGFKNYVNYVPPDVREIDEVASKYNLTKGISDYWIARKYTMLTPKNVEILQVYNGCNIYELAANVDWYHKGEFDFVVANNLLPDEVKKRFKIKDTVKTEHFQILLVDKYCYPKDSIFPYAIGE